MSTVLFATMVWAQGVGGAPAQTASPGAGGLFASFLPFLLIFIVFYFLLIMPQQKKQKAHRTMLGALKKGDRVLTSGGMLGSVAAIQDNVVTLQISDNVRVKIRKEYITELQPEREKGEGH